MDIWSKKTVGPAEILSRRKLNENAILLELHLFYFIQLGITENKRKKIEQMAFCSNVHLRKFPFDPLTFRSNFH